MNTSYFEIRKDQLNNGEYHIPGDYCDLYIDVRGVKVVFDYGEKIIGAIPSRIFFQRGYNPVCFQGFVRMEVR